MGSKARPRGSRLAVLAARQHGVVSIRQLKRTFGYSDRSVAKAVAAGRLHRVQRGVYAVGHLNLTLHGRCLAAVLACGPRALLSHYSAAWLLGLLPTQPIPVHVTTPVSRSRRPPICLHHSRTLADEDRALEDGIPVTAVPRTLLDVAAAARPDCLRRMLKRAEELKVFDLDAVESLLGRCGGHPGANRLRRALALYRPPRFTRSELERYFLDLAEQAGLPRTVTGFNEAGYELDVYWPELRFAVELDVFETHGTRESFEEDRLRQEDLKLAGVELTRVTGRRLEREPTQVLERVGRLLEQRRKQLNSGISP
jgi:hypothetical protein